MKRDGKKGIYVELPAELDAEFREFVSRFPLGTISQQIALALRRHMDSPPTIESPKLPPVSAETVEPKPAKRKPKK